MHLADHIRPLLRDHDCVIIPEFGGLVADVSPARALPGRQVLSPPTKLVAFNQALTRNDGLLVDALSQHLNLSIAQAREAVRTAVATLQQELDETNRTELPGIGIFRRAVGRGLAFEYTGTDNLLASAFGLPELAARPVRDAETRSKRPQPALRGTATRRTRLARLVPAGLVAAAVSLLLLVNYQVAVKAGYWPARWQVQGPQLAPVLHQPSPAAVAEPQQATLGQHDFSSNASPAPEGMTLVEPASPASAEVLVGSDKVAADAAPTTRPQAESNAPVAIEAVDATPVGPTPVAPATPDPPTPKVSAKAPTVITPAAKAVGVAKPSSGTTIKARTSRYFVIAGAYRSLANAEQGRKVLARTGHPAHIILPPYGSRLFRLTAADYPDLASAEREAQRLRVSTHCDYNTLKF